MPILPSETPLSSLIWATSNKWTPNALLIHLQYAGLQALLLRLCYGDWKAAKVSQADIDTAGSCSWSKCPADSYSTDLLVPDGLQSMDTEMAPSKRLIGLFVWHGCGWQRKPAR